MEKKPKLVASDIGGTLVYSGDTIPEFTARVLNRLMDINIPVALLTGYNYITTKKYSQNLNQGVILIVQNGSLAFQEDTIIWEQHIREPEALELYQFLVKKEIPVYVYKGSGHDFKIFFQSREGSPKPAPYINVSHLDDLSNTIGISTRIPNAILERTQTEIQHLIGKRFQLILSKGVRFSWLEITPLESRKDLALQKVCQKLSVPVSDVMYFGDNTNDIEALKISGMPVLVDNAVPVLKDHFDFIVNSSLQQGVAFFLNDLFDLNEKFNPS